MTTRCVVMADGLANARAARTLPACCRHRGVSCRSAALLGQASRLSAGTAELDARRSAAPTEPVCPRPPETRHRRHHLGSQVHRRGQAACGRGAFHALRAAIPNARLRLPGPLQARQAAHLDTTSVYIATPAIVSFDRWGFHLHGSLHSHLHVQRGLHAKDRGAGAFGKGETPMTANGVSAATLGDVTWRKSRHSNSKGNCVELARLGTGEIAMRNSRHPQGPALVYTPAEIDALVRGVKAGEFDDLLD